MENLINIVIVTIQFCMASIVVIGVAFIVLGILALIYLFREQKRIDDKFKDE